MHQTLPPPLKGLGDETTTNLHKISFEVYIKYVPDLYASAGDGSTVCCCGQFKLVTNTFLFCLSTTLL